MGKQLVRKKLLRSTRSCVEQFSITTDQIQGNSLSDWHDCLTSAGGVRRVSSRRGDHCGFFPEDEAVVPRKFLERNGLQVEPSLKILDESVIVLHLPARAREDRRTYPETSP
jgi:hypothetical protein